MLIKSSHLRDTKHTIYIYFPTVSSISGKIEQCEKVRALYSESIIKVTGWLINDSSFCMNGLFIAGHCWHTSFFPGFSAF